MFHVKRSPLSEVKKKKAAAINSSLHMHVAMATIIPTSVQCVLRFTTPALSGILIQSDVIGMKE